MVRHLMMAALLVGSVASAQSLRNRVEKANDRKGLRQDQRQLTDDRLDAVRAAKLLADYDAAASVYDAVRLGALDVAFNRHLAREIVESKVESAQAKQELRQDNRELRGDRRRLEGGAGDRLDRADDRVDAVKERVSRERLLGIQAQLGGLSMRFDPPSISQKRALYSEVLGVAINELGRDKQEQREDRRELREDRRP